MNRQTKIFFGVALAGIVGMLALVARDLLTLGVDVGRVTAGPDVLTLESVNIRKRLSGDLWEIAAPLLEKREESVLAKSVDIRTQRSDGAVLLLSASSARLDDIESEQRIELVEVRGIGSGDRYRLSFDARVAFWSSLSDEGVFPETLRISGEGVELVGSRGLLRRDGWCELSGGVLVRWNDEER